MASTKTIFNVSGAYSLNGTTIDLNISSANIVDATNINVAFNMDGSGDGIDDINGRNNPDTCTLVMNSVSNLLTSTIEAQTKAILQNKSADERMGSLTLSMKTDPNDQFVLDLARPSGATLIPSVDETGANTYTLELRGRITSNFKGNVD